MLTASHVLGVSLAVCRTTQNYIQNTADTSMLLDESHSVQLDSDVHTQSRRIHPQNLGASSTLKQQHRPKYPESQCRRYVIVSAHTSQFRRANLIFTPIDFSTLGSRYIWIAFTYHLREFDASLPDFRRQPAYRSR